MSEDTQQENNWAQRLRSLISRLPPEDRYRCVAGIPGPPFELRSGTIPRELTTVLPGGDYLAVMAQITGLDLARLRFHARAIGREYRWRRLITRYAELTADARSRATLALGYAAALVHRARGLSIDSNPDAGLVEVSLRVGPRWLRVAYPSNVVSLGLLWEILAEESYRVPAPVDVVYDFGANIGLSALYFGSHLPHANIVCIEPLTENLCILEYNLARNGIKSEVVRVAAGVQDGEATLFLSEQSHALPSLHPGQHGQRQVPVMAFDRIVRGTGYGLKLDIEGSEGGLCLFPSIIENAGWIVGELHYSGNPERDAMLDALVSRMRAVFEVTKARPVIYFVGQEVVLCEGFRAVQRQRAD